MHTSIIVTACCSFWITIFYLIIIKKCVEYIHGLSIFTARGPIHYSFATNQKYIRRCSTLYLKSAYDIMIKTKVPREVFETASGVLEFK